MNNATMVMVGFGLWFAFIISCSTSLFYSAYYGKIKKINKT